MKEYINWHAVFTIWKITTSSTMFHFAEKSGPVFFFLLWSPDFMSKIRKILGACLSNLAWLTNGLTNRVDLFQNLKSERKFSKGSSSCSSIILNHPWCNIEWSLKKKKYSKSRKKGPTQKNRNPISNCKIENETGQQKNRIHRTPISQCKKSLRRVHRSSRFS